MSKTIPATQTLPALHQVQANRVVESADWVTLNQAINYHYGRTGAVIGGMTFRPAWETTSTTYTTANVNATQPGSNYDLDDWQGLWKPQRFTYSSGDKYVIELNAYAENLDIRVTYTALGAQSGNPPSTDTSSGTTATTGSTNTAAITGAGWINLQSVPVSSSVWVLIYIEAKVPSTGTGYLHQFAFREKFLGSSDASSLPQGS